MKRFAVLVMLIVLVCSITSTTLAQNNSYQINLQSRTFTPDARSSRSAEVANDAPWIGLVQLNYLPTEAQAAQLAEQGIELLQYIPHNTWVAKVSPATGESRMARSTVVKWMGDLQPNDKISPELLVSAESDTSITVRILMWDGAATELAQFGQVSADNLTNGFILTVDASQLQSIAALNNTQWIEQFVAPEQLDDNLDSAVDSEAIPLTNALRGSGINVGIFDFDPMAEHSDMTGRVVVSPDFTNPPQNHATIMAGIVGAAGANHPGVATNANLIAYKFWLKEPLKTGEIDISVQAWGSPNCTNMGTYNATAANYDAITETPLVFAAGNSQYQCNANDGYQTILSGPQSGKNVITVGAIDDDGKLGSFSSQGPLLDGRIGPTLVAPGVNIKSTCLNDEYCSGTGTSFSAPAVAGAMALMLENFRIVTEGMPDPVPASYRAALTNSATDNGNVGPDFSFGFGSLNVADAVEAISEVRESSLAQGDEVQFETVVVPGQTELRITLAWDDAPASPYAETTLVNDLDLTIIDPLGNVHFPYILDAANPQVAATRGVDSVNVTEQVVIENVVPGEYRVVVNGDNVRLGSQSFSLAGVTTFSPTSVLLSQISTLSTGANAALTAVYFGMLLMAVATVWIMREQHI